MKYLTKVTALALALGLSGTANAAAINLSGNLSVDGFHPALDDQDKKTFALHLTDLEGSLALTSAGVGDLSFTGDSLMTSPSVGGLFASLINVGLSTLSSANSGQTFQFGTPVSIPFDFSTAAISSTTGGNGIGIFNIDTSFDSILFAATGNSLDIFFKEAAGLPNTFTKVSDWLFTADSSFAGISAASNQNNGSISGSFNLDNVTTSPVPVPAAVWLLGSGLMGLVGISRKKTEMV